MMMHRRRPFVGLVLAAFMCLFALGLIPAHRGSFTSKAAAGAPVLLTRPNSTRAIALEPVANLAEPFSPQAAIAFGASNQTRVMLFATNLTLITGEGPAAVSADAEDGSHAHY